MTTKFEFPSLTENEIALVYGGADDKCELADGQAGHQVGDRHKGESTGASLWRAIKEVFLGGSHC